MYVGGTLLGYRLGVGTDESCANIPQDGLTGDELAQERVGERTAYGFVVTFLRGRGIEPVVDEWSSRLGSFIQANAFRSLARRLNRIRSNAPVLQDKLTNLDSNKALGSTMLGARRRR
jgi:hypothetical protein